MSNATVIQSTHFWDHSRFMPDFCEKAVSISCCDAVSVGTGLEDGVGAGATNARRISSVVAIRMKSWSLTMHRLLHRKTPVENSEVNFKSVSLCTLGTPVANLRFYEYYSFCSAVLNILAHLPNLPCISSWDCDEHARESHGGLTRFCINSN